MMHRLAVEARVRLQWPVLLAILVWICLPPTAFSQTTADSSLPAILARAYSMLKVNSPDAEYLFVKAARMDPGNLLVRKQLGYLYISQGKSAEALEQFSAVDSLQPSDSAKLQIAYLLMAVDRNRDAERVFKGLTTSSNADISERASAQLDAMLPGGSSEWWNRIYAAPYYDTRWQTTFYQAFLQRGYYLTEDRILTGYGFISTSGDARSSGGLSPVIFSDNALIFGLGLRATVVKWLQLSVQEGLAFDLIDRASRSRTRGDFRAVALAFTGIYAPYTYHPDWQSPLAPFADVYGSAGYYSRYDNGIAYLTGRAGLRVLEVSRSVLDAYAKASLARDTQKEYYNNLVEGGLGLRLMPNVNWGLYVVAEFTRGTYWDVGGTHNPYDSYYSSYRFFLIFDRMF